MADHWMLCLMVCLSRIAPSQQQVKAVRCAPTKAPVVINTGSCDCSTPGSGSSCSSSLEARVKALETRLLGNAGTILQNCKLGTTVVIRDCRDVFQSGNTTDGIYYLRPEGATTAFQAQCIFNSEGAWTVIQQRSDPTVDFQRNWAEYRRGFGIFNNNMWLGNEKLYLITQQRQYKLRIDLFDWQGYGKFAEYKYFQVDSEKELYRLHLANFSGTIGDAFSNYHNGMKFSTFDRDNDIKKSEHCARLHKGGWWYRDCDRANLNGVYHTNPNLKTSMETGIEWDTWRKFYSLKKTVMKIQPAFPN